MDTRLAGVGLLLLVFAIAVPAAAQMPTPQEMEKAMRDMQKAMDSLTPEQRRMLEQTQGELLQQAMSGADDNASGVPARDAARIARVAKEPLTGAQLRTHVEALQPKIAQALAPAARQRAVAIESAVRKDGGDVAGKMAATANGLAAWGAWPEATYLMGKAALESGSAQDLNNLAAFLTMQHASAAALPILITLDARYPDNSTLLNNLGQAWFELGEVKEAERVLTLAVRRTPNHPQANVTKSRIEEARGDMAAAQASMRAALQGGFSEGKAQRLSRLGGKLQKSDLRWTLPIPADGLGLGKFVPPALPEKWTELEAKGREWHTFRDDVGAALEPIRRQQAELARKTPWLGDAALHGPFTAKAGYMVKFNTDAWEEKLRSSQQSLTEAIHFEQQKGRAMQDALEKVHAAGREKYRNVAGGYQYEYSCGEIRTQIDQYLDQVNPQLVHAQQDLLEFQRTYANETLYFQQFMSTPESYEYAVLTAKAEYLNTLKGLPASGDNYGLMQRYGNSCLKPDKPPRSGGKLPDFDVIHCDRIVRFDIPIGYWEVRCNRAHIEFGVRIPLDALTADVKVKWNEDLRLDRVLDASAEVGISDPTEMVRVVHAGHVEFDDDGIKSGGIRAGAQVRAGKSGAGPMEVSLKGSTSVGIEFDRNGVADVRLEAGVKSQASSRVRDIDPNAPKDGTKAGTAASAELKGNWSWNAGASGAASSSFKSTF